MKRLIAIVEWPPRVWRRKIQIEERKEKRLVNFQEREKEKFSVRYSNEYNNFVEGMSFRLAIASNISKESRITTGVQIIKTKPNQKYICISVCVIMLNVYNSIYPKKYNNNNNNKTATTYNRKKKRVKKYLTHHPFSST